MARTLYNSRHTYTDEEMTAALPPRGGMSRQDKRMVAWIIVATLLLGLMAALHQRTAPPPQAPTSAPRTFARPAPDTTKPGRDDFIRAAGAICLADLSYYQSMAPSASKTDVWMACVRAYLAREGLTLP